MTARPPTVLLLITTFDIGGAERVYQNIAVGLAGRGYRVFAASLDARSGAVTAELEGTAVATLDLGMRTAASAPRAVARLIRVLRRERVDIVYTFLIHPHVLGRLAARIAGVPVVVSSQQVMSWESRFAELLNRSTAHLCSAIVGVSENVSEYLANDLGISREKVVTIYNCIDISRFPCCDSKRPERPGPVIGSIARLNPEKDQTTLLRAFAQLCPQYPTSQLLIAGEGPERPRLEALAETIGIRGRVRFLGHVSDVADLHAQLDIFVQPSHAEGLPVAVLEALASCLPVIAMRVGGNDEAVVDGRGGLLVPPGNPSTLAAAIVRLVNDPAEARRMGEFGRAHVQRLFSAEAAVSATDALFRRLLNGESADGGAGA